MLFRSFPGESLRGIIHQPYQLIALVPADKLFRNVFRVAGIAGSSLYAAKDDFLPADGEDSAEIERDALKSRFPYSFLYIPRFFVYSCSRLSLSADLATVCPTSVFSFRRFGSFLPYLCFFFRQIQQHPALFSFFHLRRFIHVPAPPTFSRPQLPLLC